jgi:hypothetical protein
MTKKSKKSLKKSKTIWGFGLAILIAFAQSNGIVADSNLIAEIAQLLTTVLGVIGARDALN